MVTDIENSVEVSSISVGLLMPFGHNHFHVAMVMDFFKVLKKWYGNYGQGVLFELEIIQTQGRVNEYGDTYHSVPVKSVLYDKIYDYVIIPPFDFDDIDELVERNNLFKEWVTEQFEGGALMHAIGDGIILLALTEIITPGEEIKVSGVSSSFYQYFDFKQSSKLSYLQKTDSAVISSGSIRTFYMLFDLIKELVDEELIVQLAKHYQIDLNLIESKYYDDFEFVYEVEDEHIQRVLDKIHRKYDQMTSLEEVLDEYPGSRRSFNRNFAKHIHKTPVEYLQNVRVSHAKRLLETTEDTIEQVAKSVGYGDVKSFRIIFVRLTAIQPLEYRKRMQIKNLDT